VSAVSNVDLRVNASQAMAALNRLNGAAKGTAGTLGALKQLAASVGIGYLAKQSLQAAASFNDLKTRLKLLSSEYGEYEKATKLAAQAAKKFGLSTRESTQGITDIYARLKPLGVSLEDIKTTYMGFNTVAKLSGVSSMEAAGAFRQLSQALGSGKLQGDEYRSMAENVPGLMKLIADELKVNVGDLKELSSQSKLTSEVIIASLRRAQKEGAGKIAAIVGNSEVQVFKDMTNAVDDLAIAVGDGLAPAITPLIQELTRFLQQLDPVFIGQIAKTGVFITKMWLLHKVFTAIVGIGPTLKLFFNSYLVNVKTAGKASFIAAGQVASFSKSLQMLAKSTLVLAAFQVTFEWFSKIVEKGKEARDIAKQLEKGGAGKAIDRKTTSRESVAAMKADAQKQIDALLEEYDDMIEEKKGQMQIPIWNAIVGVNLEGERQVIEKKIADLKTILDVDLGEFKTADEIAAAADAATNGINKMGDAAEALKEKTKEIAAAFQDDVTGAIMSAVRGSETLGEAFGKVLNRLADQVMEVALNMALWGSAGGGGTGGLLGGLFKGIFGSAQGGTIGAGNPRMVGERGPELFVPHSSGQVIPNNRLGGGGTNITVNVDASGSDVEGNEAEGRELGEMLAAAIQSALIQEKRPGGLLAGT